MAKIIIVYNEEELVHLASGFKSMLGEGAEVYFVADVEYPCCVKATKVDERAAVLTWFSADESALFMETLRKNKEDNKLEGYNYAESAGDEATS